MLPSHLRLLVAALLVGVTCAFEGVVRAAAPDPSIVYANGYYHMTYTSADHIEMVRARTLKGLLIGKVRQVYFEPNITRNAYILTPTHREDPKPQETETLPWVRHGRDLTMGPDGRTLTEEPRSRGPQWAPEIHQIDGVWYIFYSSGSALQSVEDSVRPRVLQGCTAATPYYCLFRWRADLVPPAGLQGGSDGRDPFGIDSSYLEVPGRGRYHLLSARNARGQQSVQIAPLDTRTWNVTGWHVISEPEYAWERNVSNSRPRELWIGDVAVNEGPHALYNNDQIWITFSASHCQTPNYAIGLLRYNGGDPLLKSSWDKSASPVFSPANGNYGTGHNSFFKSPDGTETWMAFHATAIQEGSCDDGRYAMAQPVRFLGNNTPSFGTPLNLDDARDPPSGENLTSLVIDEGEMPLERRFWMRM